MKKYFTFAFIVAVGLVCGSSRKAASQDFATQVQSFVGQNATAFLKPVADGFITDLNGGLFSTAEVYPFHIGVKLVVMGTVISDAQKTFQAIPFSNTVSFPVVYGGQTYTITGKLNISGTGSSLPTAVGLSKPVTVTGSVDPSTLTASRNGVTVNVSNIPGLASYIASSGYLNQTKTFGGNSTDLPTVPLLAPQISIGSIFGTEAMFRFIPTVTGDFGKVSFFGFGIKHNIGRYIKLPVDLAFQFSLQNLKIEAKDSTDGNFSLKLAATSYQIQASKTLGFGALNLTPYAGLAYEHGSLDIGYTSHDPYVGSQSLSFTGSNSFRVTVGARVKILIFTVNADYNIAAVSGYTAGFGLLF
jgi:hypothetical protein